LRLSGHTVGRIFFESEARPPELSAVEEEHKTGLDTMHALTERRSTWQHATILVAKFNWALREWGERLLSRYNEPSASGDRSYTGVRLRWWLRRKHGKTRSASTRTSTSETGSYGVPSPVGARLGSMPRPIGHSTMLPGATPTIRDTILYVSSLVLLHRAYFPQERSQPSVVNGLFQASCRRVTL
jgi:hypothetical protein